MESRGQEYGETNSWTAGRAHAPPGQLYARLTLVSYEKRTSEHTAHVSAAHVCVSYERRQQAHHDDGTSRVGTRVAEAMPVGTAGEGELHEETKRLGERVEPTV